MAVRIYDQNPNPRQVRQVAECLSRGGLAVVPTDTVYGIACSLEHSGAIEKLARIRDKKAKEANFSLVCADISQVADYTKPIDNAVYRLMRKNLPGPFTFILEANNKLAKILKFNRKNIGVRIPGNNVTQEIIKELGMPLIITSVKDNEQDEYLTDPSLIEESYAGVVDLVVDAGIGQSEGSTVVDLTGDEPDILRQGLGTLQE